MNKKLKLFATWVEKRKLRRKEVSKKKPVTKGAFGKQGV